MAGETVVETPQDNTKVEEPIKTDKEVIAEEEAAQANEVGIILQNVTSSIPTPRCVMQSKRKLFT